MMKVWDPLRKKEVALTPEKRVRQWCIGVLRERMGEDPVILFDDVLSELDNDRQDYLLNELKGCQVFITCCEKSNKEQLNEGKVFYVEGGEVTELRAE